MKEDFLSEETRADDILLGSLGVAEEATIISIELKRRGYRGIARRPDGEEFLFESDDDLDDLEKWALGIISKRPAF